MIICEKYSCNITIKDYICITKKSNMKLDITQLCSQQEYADMIGVSQQAINKKVKDGKIKTRRIAGKDMIYLPDLQ